METGKISDGIQATIGLLESIPVKGQDLETTGLGIMTALRNLRIIKEAVLRAERGERFDQPKPEEQYTVDIEAEPGDAYEEAGEDT